MRSVRLIPLVSLLAGLVPGAPAEGAAAPLPRHDGKHILVKFRGDVSRPERLGAHRKHGARLKNRLGPQRVDVVRVANVPDALRRYRRDPSVAFAMPNQVYSVDVVPNDPGFSQLYGLDNTGQAGGTPDADIDAPEGWDLVGGTTGSPWPAAGYAVGVIDTGVDHQHSDLNGRTITDCSTAFDNGTLGPGCGDVNGHGSHAAGTIAAIANNGVGIAGVAFNARIYMCKGLGDNGQGTDAAIAACVNDIVARRSTHNIRVISLSFGGPHSPVLQSAVDTAAANGVLVVASAGNEGNALVNFPAGYASVVSVGATDRFDAHADFSNINADVELVAAGVDVLSTVPGGFATASGTSFSAPHVAGAAALVSFKTGQTGQGLRDLLTGSADDLGTPGRDPAFGFGRVNLCRALGGNCAQTVPPPGVNPPVNPPVNLPPAIGTIDGTGFKVRGSGSTKPKKKIDVCVTGATSTCARTIRGGSYTLQLPVGQYSASANRKGKMCRANSTSGPASFDVRLTPGATVTVNWFC